MLGGWNVRGGGEGGGEGKSMDKPWPKRWGRQRKGRRRRFDQWSKWRLRACGGRNARHNTCKRHNSASQCACEEHHMRCVFTLFFWLQKECKKTVCACKGHSVSALRCIARTHCVHQCGASQGHSACITRARLQGQQSVHDTGRSTCVCRRECARHDSHKAGAELRAKVHATTRATTRAAGRAGPASNGRRRPKRNHARYRCARSPKRTARATTKKCVRRGRRQGNNEM